MDRCARRPRERSNCGGPDIVAAMSVPYGNLLGRALKLLRAGDAAAADTICRHVVAVDPRNATALHLAGIVAHDLADHARSFEMMNRAIEVQPALDEAHCGRGIAQRHLARPDAAVADFERAVALNPRNAQALYYLGLSRLEHDDLPGAAEKLEAALAVEPDLAMALANLGLVRDRQGRLDEAVALCRRATEIQPRLEIAQNNLAAALQKLGRVSEALSILRQLETGTSDPLVGANVLTSLNLVPGDRATLLEEARLWAKRFADPLTPAPHLPTDDPARRLKIGYVAADGLRRHTLAMTYWPLFEAHDPREVETFAYSDLPDTREDDVTRRVKATVAFWRRTGDLSDAALAEQIRADKIDILVDGIGFVAGSRLLAAARRPAPIQVHFPPMSTTGMAAFDYIIGDRNLLPDGSDKFFSEGLWRLPCGFVYRPVDPLPPLAEPPVRRNGYVTFGSFNRVAKIGPEAVTIWAAVLAAVPSSRLLIATSTGISRDTAERYSGLFAQHGITSERIILDDRGDHGAGALRRFNEVDIALDTLPFSGVLTTCAALAMGVPVVTWAGSRILERYGVALLTAAGFVEGIAPDFDGYVARAAMLARDAQLLGTLRATLRDRLLASPLCDAPRFARSIESAYRSMWQRWCAGVPAKAAPSEATPR